MDRQQETRREARIADVTALADAAVALALSGAPEDEAVRALLTLAAGDRRAVEIARGRCLRVSSEVVGAERAASFLGSVLVEME